jgi:hypothetical protein
MTTKQANRAGRPWQRKDGRWAARAYPPDGSKPKMVYGTTEAEVVERQAEAEAVAPELGTGVPNLPTRTKPVRVTLDLDQATYKELNQWLGTAAAEVGAPVSKARALRAMIRAVSLDKSIGFVVIDLLRREA